MFELQEKTLDAAGLAELLHLCPATVKKDLSRAPHRLPPPVVVPGRKAFLWIYSDVIDWLRKNTCQARAAAVPPAPSLSTTVKRGAPSKIERVESRRRGITVAELRKSKGGAA